MIGKLSQDEVDAVLETLPIEFSVLDANDQVVGWNKHETRIFKRPVSALGLNVHNCHPHHSLHKSTPSSQRCGREREIPRGSGLIYTWTINQRHRKY